MKLSISYKNLQNNSFQLANKEIGNGHKPFIIAEISGNHLQSFERAKKLISIAKKSGADAVKLQTFKPNTITIANDKRFKLRSGTWEGEDLAELYKKTQTPWEWHKNLFDYADKIGINIFSSPFDIDAVNFLSELNVFAYKIASNEARDWYLIEKIIEKEKPIIISTGTLSKKDLIKTIEFIRKKGCNEICILHCISSYPAKISEMSLNTIIEIQNLFNLPVGISDHSLDIHAAVASVALGACVIEKHITISRDDKSPDAKFSLEPKELEDLCYLSNQIWKATKGKITYGGDRDLQKDSIFTRQLWTKKEIFENETISWENIKSVRAPIAENGISSMDYEKVINKKSIKKIKVNQPLKKEYLENEKY